MEDLQNKTIAELRAMRNDLSHQRDRLKASQMPIIAAINAKAAEEAAARKVSRMSGPERRAVLRRLQQLKPLGVVSAEFVGEPGK
jgi:hypothetical protein